MRFAGMFLMGLAAVCMSPRVEAADSVTVPNCLLALDEEAQVPAQEAGVLTKILVREGQQVASGEWLAQIDDAIPKMQQAVAQYKFKVAEREAQDDVNIRYARAAADVARADYLQAEEANKKVSGTVPQAEVRQRLLKWREMELSIEKAQKDMAVAALQAQVAEAEVQASAVNVARRRMTAPLDAVVVELTKHEGEWAQAGDPVMRIVRIDRLRVEGFLNTKDYRLSELRDRPVNVAVTLARGQTETFPGKVVFVKPIVEAGGEFLVRAEVQNRKQNGAWVLSPGLNAAMTIELK